MKGYLTAKSGTGTDITNNLNNFYDFIFNLKKWLSVHNKLLLVTIFYDTPEARTLRVNIRTNYSSFVDLLNTDFFRYIYQNRRLLQ